MDHYIFGEGKASHQHQYGNMGFKFPRQEYKISQINSILKQFIVKRSAHFLTAMYISEIQVRTDQGLVVKI